MYYHWAPGPTLSNEYGSLYLYLFSTLSPKMQRHLVGLNVITILL